MQNIPDCLKGFKLTELCGLYGKSTFEKDDVSVRINVAQICGTVLDKKLLAVIPFRGEKELAEAIRLVVLTPHDRFIEWVKSTDHFPQLLHTHGDRLFICETGGMFKVQAIQLAWEAYNAKT